MVPSWVGSDVLGDSLLVEGRRKAREEERSVLCARISGHGVRENRRCAYRLRRWERAQTRRRAMREGREKDGMVGVRNE